MKGIAKKEILGRGLSLVELSNQGDERGRSYNIPLDTLNFVGIVRDVHVATIVPNATRGNHYHVNRKEFILVWYDDSWVLAWDQGEGTKADVKLFWGAGIVLLEVDSEISHAIKNTGSKDMSIIAFSNHVFDQHDPRTYRRVVMPAEK